MATKYILTFLLAVTAFALSLVAYVYQRDSERSGNVIADMLRTIDDQNKQLNDYAKRLRMCQDAATVWIYCLPDCTPCEIGK